MPAILFLIGLILGVGAMFYAFGYVIFCLVYIALMILQVIADCFSDG